MAAPAGEGGEAGRIRRPATDAIAGEKAALELARHFALPSETPDIAGPSEQASGPATEPGERVLGALEPLDPGECAAIASSCCSSLLAGARQKGKGKRSTQEHESGVAKAAGRAVSTAFALRLAAHEVSGGSVLASSPHTKAGMRALCNSLTLDAATTCVGAGGDESDLVGLLRGSAGARSWAAECALRMSCEANTAASLNCARHLIRSFVALSSAPAAGTGGRADDTTYLRDASQEGSTQAKRCSAFSAECFLDPRVQLSALRQIAVRRCVHCVNRLSRFGKDAWGGIFASWDGEVKVPLDGRAWQDCAPDLVALSHAHCTYVACALLLRKSAQVAAEAEAEEGEGEVTKRASLWTQLISSVFAIQQLKKKQGELLEDGYLQIWQAQMLSQIQERLLATFAPEIASLVGLFHPFQPLGGDVEGKGSMHRSRL